MFIVYTLMLNNKLKKLYQSVVKLDAEVLGRPGEKWSGSAHLITRLGWTHLRLSLEYSVEFTVGSLEHLDQPNITLNPSLPLLHTTIFQCLNSLYDITFQKINKICVYSHFMKKNLYFKFLLNFGVWLWW